MRLIMFLLFFSIFSFAMSADQVAQGSIKEIGMVEKVKGLTKVTREGSIKKITVKEGMKIQKGDLVSTTSSATALLKLIDGSTIVLDKASTIHFASLDSAEQKEGSVYYKITHRDAKNSLSVKTPFAIIGIKGTTFIVNAKEDDSSVALQEGRIGIAAIKEEFALYRKKVQEEFNNYKNQQQAAYEAYKKEMQGGTAEMVKEFELDAGNRVSFNEQNATESGFNEDTNASFEHFKDIINSMK